MSGKNLTQPGTLKIQLRNLLASGFFNAAND